MAYLPPMYRKKKRSFPLPALTEDATQSVTPVEPPAPPAPPPPAPPPPPQEAAKEEEKTTKVLFHPEMLKAELLEKAQSLGLDVGPRSRKDEIVEALEESPLAEKDESWTTE